MIDKEVVLSECNAFCGVEFRRRRETVYVRFHGWDGSVARLYKCGSLIRSGTMWNIVARTNF